MSKGRPPERKSPHQKKALSYARDRRNDYGQNDKASRRLIPIQKAKSQRRLRRKADQAVAAIEPADEARVDLVESDIRRDIGRVGSWWRKWPDLALGHHIKRQHERADMRVGGKARRRKADGDPA
jgi:hypothetical protein